MTIQKEYFSAIINQLSTRSAEATLSILGISNPNLRQFLSEKFNQPIGEVGSDNFLTDPVFEAIFNWEEATNVTLNSLVQSGLLARSFVDAMDRPPHQQKDYRFGRTWSPYKHQLKAWELLSRDKAESAVITSGTGSGKTECFMIPVLNDLVREHEQTHQKLVGVRALFIYPLNALINSQRNRLLAWTKPFKDNVRFCLYNGNTKEIVQAQDQNNNQNQILSRALLRHEPAPLLVTNATMLEYMLVRQIDAPILEKSQGKLRWIVLDEAHTYIGSQAAELSLLLRRVVHAFGVDAKDIRFVATSATIGDKDTSSLQRYLADLAGVDIDKVTVVGGSRYVPIMEKMPTIANETTIQTLWDIADDGQEDMISAHRYNALAGHAISKSVRDSFTNGYHLKTLTQLSNEIFPQETNKAIKYRNTLEWLDLCTGTKKNEKTPFLPIRAHLFHQKINGLWCCVDANCSLKQNTSLKDDWGFGYVYSQQREYCECGAPVYELVFCSECNQPHLRANIKNEYLVQLNDTQGIDEFNLDDDSQNENESDDENTVDDNINEGTVIISSIPVEPNKFELNLSKDKQLGIGNIIIYVSLDHEVCASCGFDGYKNQKTFRRALLGAPFYISNTVPTLLEHCKDGQNPESKPGRGRRLITFNDSRQGTARIAVKVQQDSERNRIRGLIYEMVSRQTNDEAIKILEEERNDLLTDAQMYRNNGNENNAVIRLDRAESKQQEIDNLKNNNVVTWEDAARQLRTNTDITHAMLDYYHQLTPNNFGTHDAVKLSNVLLLKEFYARPKRQNSLETLGLVSVKYPGLNNVMEPPPPMEWKSLTLDDWKDFLKICVDYFLRNGFMKIERDLLNSIGVRISSGYIFSAAHSDENNKDKKFPTIKNNARKRQHRLIRLLACALNLNPTKDQDSDIINRLMLKAWSDLVQSGILTPSLGQTSYQVNFEKFAFSRINKAWICPITNKLLDTTLNGITPYLPYNQEWKIVTCTPVTMPQLPFDIVMEGETYNERVNRIRAWIKNNSDVSDLRNQNLWTDLTDRILEGGMFFRAAEHSAQQPAIRLQEFENLFSAERLNVLSCSTTMEMGVDIGGISTVAMNNVPPHPANYLQRAGRAGRRQETRALAFTLCKDNPHERSVFNNPVWAFTTKVKSPYITLDSPVIVQRHINSLVFSYFLKNSDHLNHGDNTLTLNCGWFFFENTSFQYNRFCSEINDYCELQVPEKLNTGLLSLVKNSIYEGISIKRLLCDVVDAMSKIKENWHDEYKPLERELNLIPATVPENNPYKRRVKKDLERLKNEYLLSELATRGFLPAYGFPVGVASFDIYNIADYIQFNNDNKKDINFMRIREKPSRDLATAIREYAPGNDIVLNGLVHRSAGITLNWIPEAAALNQKLIKIGRCSKCGAIHESIATNFSETCEECGALFTEDNCREFIQPIGFSVNFYSTPTTDISMPSYIPVQEPWVTAKSSLNSLPNSDLGYFRSSNSDVRGTIFHHSSGINGTGYALCWYCGRSESMTSTIDLPPIFKTPHFRLQGAIGDNDKTCPGSNNAFGIKKGIHLGYSSPTDVLELYLKRQENDSFLKHNDEIDEKVAWTLAVVLRQALAESLGINQDELGFTVKPTKLHQCDYAVATIAIYDNASGGAGFVSSAQNYFQGSNNLFIKAKKYLYCTCKSVCQNCLLGFDTRFRQSYLDRQLALDFLSDTFMNRLELPEHFKILGESSRFTPNSFLTEIRQAASRGANELRIFLHGNSSQWEMAASPIFENTYIWKQQYSKVVFIIDSNQINNLPDTVKEDLWAKAHFGIQFAYTDFSQNVLIKSSGVIAQILSMNGIKTLACSQLSSAIPTQEWMEHNDANILIVSDNYAEINLQKFDHNLLKPISKPTDVEVEIMMECNGNISKFSGSFWLKLIENHPLLKQHIINRNSLEKISYYDRYLHNPWSVILITEIINRLKSLMKENWNNPPIQIVLAPKFSENRHGKGLFSDWGDDAIRRNIIQSYFAYFSEKCIATIDENSPHCRYLELKWVGGETTTIRFDQGVGYWTSNGRPPWFDNFSSVAEQVSNMALISKSLMIKNYKDNPTQIFIKER